LNSFGPNVTPAKDLLAQGQAQPMLEYIAECKSFWKLDYGKLDEWIGAIRAGGTPILRPICITNRVVPPRSNGNAMAGK
jgi:hypothetical protein